MNCNKVLIICLLNLADLSLLALLTHTSAFLVYSPLPLRQPCSSPTMSPFRNCAAAALWLSEKIQVTEHYFLLARIVPEMKTHWKNTVCFGCSLHCCQAMKQQGRGWLCWKNIQQLKKWFGIFRNAVIRFASRHKRWMTPPSRLSVMKSDGQSTWKFNYYFTCSLVELTVPTRGLWGGGALWCGLWVLRETLIGFFP